MEDWSRGGEGVIGWNGDVGLSPLRVSGMHPARRGILVRRALLSTPALRISRTVKHTFGRRPNGHSVQSSIPLCEVPCMLRPEVSNRPEPFHRNRSTSGRLIHWTKWRLTQPWWWTIAGGFNEPPMLVNSRKSTDQLFVNAKPGRPSSKKRDERISTPVENKKIHETSVDNS